MRNGRIGLLGKRNVYAAKAKRIIVVLLLLSVFATASMIAAYSSQSSISTHPLIDAGVSPLKVRPGDTMLITASCVDSAGIETVTADMGGIETIQLSLISGTICNGTWQDTWLVHDTEVRDYNTTVTATNVFGESSSVNIGWSDPATEGMGAYGEGTVTTPRYRLCYVGTGWGDEQSANEVGGEINMVVLRAAPTRNEKILGVLDKSGHINVQVWSGSSWGNGLEVTTAIGANYIYRGFDIAYEDSSGDALIVYQNNTDDPLYRVWNGTGWSDAVTLDLPTAGIPVWIRLKSKPGSDEIIVATLDLGEDVTAAVWNGSAWGNNISLETAAESSEYNGIAIAYESTSGDAMVAWSDGALKSGGPQYIFWNGTAWGVEATAPETGGEPLYLELGSDPDPSSDKIVMGAIDAGRDVNVNVWDGAAWGTNEEVTAGAEISVSKPADVEFESTSSEAIVAYSENGDPVLHYNTWSAGTWSVQWDGPNFGSDIQTCDLCSCPYSDDIMLGAVTEDNYLSTARWSGSAWGTVDVLETGVSSTYAMFMFAPDRCFTISDVDGGGPYKVGNTISVTWNLTGSASATEEYINVEYWDVTAGTQFNLTSHAPSATSSTSKALTSSKVGHKINVYVYTTSSSSGDNSTAITQGDPWPYSIIDAVVSWESYAEAAHTNVWGTAGHKYDSSNHTAYMYGEGFKLNHDYKVAYYDTDGWKVQTEFTNSSGGAGALSSQYDFTSNVSSAPGTWHCVVLNTTGSAPNTYDEAKADANYTVDDAFEVEQSAIPEFPTVVAAIAVCMLCAVAYVVMRRRAGKR